MSSVDAGVGKNSQLDQDQSTLTACYFFSDPSSSDENKADDGWIIELSCILENL